jgi:cell division control protein 6
MHFQHSFPQRGLSSEEALQVLLSILDERDMHLILALDETEALIRREGPNPLYNLTRAQESRLGSPSRLSIICVFREPECEEVMKILDKSTLSSLQPNTIHLKQYTSGELSDILLQRVEEAFKPDAVEAETVELISHICEESGSARYAIELLHRSGIRANMDRSPKVLPKHVREARAELLPSLQREDLRALDKHERIALLALARYLAEREIAYLTMGELRNQYLVVCEERGEKPLGYTQFWKRLKGLSDLGLVLMKPSGRGQRGRTTLVSSPIPPYNLKSELEGMM